MGIDKLEMVVWGLITKRFVCQPMEPMGVWIYDIKKFFCFFVFFIFFFMFAYF